MDARRSEQANLLHLYAAEHVLKLSAKLLTENIDENRENKEDESGKIGKFSLSFFLLIVEEISRDLHSKDLWKFWKLRTDGRDDFIYDVSPCATLTILQQRKNSFFSHAAYDVCLGTIIVRARIGERVDHDLVSVVIK